MKKTFLLLCLSVCLFAFLQPVADAACSGGTTIFVTQTAGPPGPYGTISVESSPPGAHIYLNGQTQGLSPVTISSLWPGNYEITAKMSGYQTFTTITTISGATRSSIFCRLVPDTPGGGGLVITSSPEKATVFLDGMEKGVTPLSLNNPEAGSHSIRLRLSGYEIWETTVNTREGVPTIVTATLNEKEINTDQGITITSVPSGATVTLDGLAKGFTPVSLHALAPGIHVIQLDRTGYRTWKSAVDVPETGVREIPVTLVPDSGSPGWISVASTPGNATITLDGNYAGTTPAGGPVILAGIPAGEHRILLELAGYLPYTATAQVEPNQSSPVAAVLVSSGPAKGSLSVTSEPAGAEIFIDNRPVGISPYTADGLPAGNHLVVLRLAGFENYSASVPVPAGSTGTVSAGLVPASAPQQSAPLPETAVAALVIIGCVAVIRRT
jgi:hypothetical protein